jgi:Asp-tRNA(Asn)/Glu-tRNA(Gln) amidotransferase A subunit family amidase
MAVNTYPASLVDTARSLRTDERSVAEYVAESCDRLDEIEPDVQAFVPESSRRERLRVAASTLKAESSEPADRGPLHGVPVGVKDIFHVDDLPTRAGSDLSPETLAGPEAAVVRELRAAGALVLGKTRTTEFAYFEPGPTRNPHDLDHTPGGSSSGSAAAVATGECPLALGSQTIGSVIRPAAFCGVVGLKPTYSRVPVEGVIPVASSLDHVGWFTQDVAGARLAATVLCEDWAAGTATAPESLDPSERPTIGVPDGPYLEQASSEGIEAFERQVEDLEAAGYEIRRVRSFGEVETVNGRHEALMAAEMAIAHGERGWYPAYTDQYSETTADLIETGRAVSAGTIGDVRTDREATCEALLETMEREGIDLWVSPAAPGPAPEGINDTGDPVMNLPWTHVGAPALTVPAGTVDGLPVGLQCTARPMDDERLLAWGEGIESTLTGR